MTGYEPALELGCPLSLDSIVLPYLLAFAESAITGFPKLAVIEPL